MQLESEVWELLFGTLTRRERQQTEKTSLARTRPAPPPPPAKEGKPSSGRKQARKAAAAQETRTPRPSAGEGPLTTTSRRSGRVRRHRFSVLDVVGSDDEFEEEEWAYMQPSKRAKPSRPTPSSASPPLSRPTQKDSSRAGPVERAGAKPKRSTRADTPYGAPPKQELMMVCFGDDLRQPPQELLDQFQRMNKVFGLGATLRECTDPDFIAAAVSSGVLSFAKLVA